MQIPVLSGNRRRQCVEVKKSEKAACLDSGLRVICADAAESFQSVGTSWLQSDGRRGVARLSAAMDSPAEAACSLILTRADEATTMHLRSTRA